MSGSYEFKSAIEEVKRKLDLLTVISKRVEVKRKGNLHLALCPFHNEKTPSFNIDNRNGFYYCFGCGATGDIIKFVQEFEKLSFIEALRYLADQAGVALPSPSAEEYAKAQKLEQKRLEGKQILNYVTNWFHQQLFKVENSWALQYVFKRNISQDIIKRFSLGFSPRFYNLNSVICELGKVQDQDLVELGLKSVATKALSPAPEKPKMPESNEHLPVHSGAARGSAAQLGAARRTYEFFRNRLMFPIKDRRGNTIAFGARTLDGSNPKYLNSRESIAFHKKYNLFGLYEGLKYLRPYKYVMLVEGYLDVISLHQRGYFAVAPLGTAVTQEQLYALQKLGERIIICLDGDEAGGKAMLKCANLLLGLADESMSSSFKFATLPQGEDPDSLVQTRGSAALDKVISDSMFCSEFLWRNILNQAGVAAVRPGSHLLPEVVLAIKKSVGEQLSLIGNANQRSTYRHFFTARMAELLHQDHAPGVAPELLRRGNHRYRSNFKSYPGFSGAFAGTEAGQAHLHFLSSTSQVPSVLKSNPDTIPKEILHCIIEHPGLYYLFDEQIAKLNFVDTELEQLKQFVVDFLNSTEYTDHQGEESAALGQKIQLALAKNGYNTIFNKVKAATITPNRLSYDQAIVSVESMLERMMLQTIQAETHNVNNRRDANLAPELRYEKILYYRKLIDLQQKATKTNGTHKS